MEEKLSEKTKVLERLEETKSGENVIKDSPKVSVIIPAYNISEFISDTLDSVLAQTFKNFEIIVVNDGSKDTVELEKVLENYADKIVYGRQKNLGASEARNAAICLSRGELIAFLDGDDLWFPNCLEKQVEFLEENHLDMVYCDAELFGDNFFKGNTYMETTPSSGEVNPISLINASCNVITSGTMVTRKILEKVNLFDTGLRRAQDFDLWFRLAKHGAKIVYQRNILAKYRESSNSLSGSYLQRVERSIGILNFIREKYELTPAEHKALERQLEFSQADVELEKRKLNLIKGDYDEARKQIGRANLYYRKPKLLLLKLLLQISPALTVKLLKKFRPKDFSFISPAEK